MRYRASNGVLPAVELSEAEARTHWENASHVTGEFGGRFVICPLGEMGHVLTIAATTYEPVKEPPKHRRRRPASRAHAD